MKLDRFASTLEMWRQRHRKRLGILSGKEPGARGHQGREFEPAPAGGDRFAAAEGAAGLQFAAVEAALEHGRARRQGRNPDINRIAKLAGEGALAPRQGAVGETATG